jgi:hypothetical protein
VRRNFFKINTKKPVITNRGWEKKLVWVLRDCSFTALLRKIQHFSDERGCTIQHTPVSGKQI